MIEPTHEVSAPRHGEEEPRIGEERSRQAAERGEDHQGADQRRAPAPEGERSERGGHRGARSHAAQAERVVEAPDERQVDRHHEGGAAEKRRREAASRGAHFAPHAADLRPAEVGEEDEQQRRRETPESGSGRVHRSARGGGAGHQEERRADQSRQAAQLDRDERVLGPQRKAGAEQVNHRDPDQDRRRHADPRGSAAMPRGEIVRRHHRQPHPGARRNQEEGHPAEQTGRPGAVGAAQVDELAARFRKPCPELGVDQRSEARQEAAGQPAEEDGTQVAEMARDQLRRRVDPDPDGDGEQHHARVEGSDSARQLPRHGAVRPAHGSDCTLEQARRNLPLGSKSSLVDETDLELDTVAQPAQQGGVQRRELAGARRIGRRDSQHEAIEAFLDHLIARHQLARAALDHRRHHDVVMVEQPSVRHPVVVDDPPAHPLER